MEAALLLENFDVLASAPNGVKKLRELILQLAVQGKLVPQDPKDEPASVLLEKIRKEKAAKGDRRPLSSVEEPPFALPGGWEWARFGDLTINRDGERIPVSREHRHTRQGPYDYYGASGVIDCIDNYLFDKPLLLIGEDGANLLNRSTPIAFIASGKYWVNNHAHVIDGISLDFLLYLELFVNATDLGPYVTGTAQPKMNQAKMNSIPVSLPPLAEQKRIVEKVDQLMALCDELEARQEEQKRLQVAVNASALNSLMTAEDKPTFKKAWKRVEDHFDLLYDSPENVKALRGAIQDLAARGKLVAQDPKDEPVSALLEKMRDEKAKLVKRGNTGRRERGSLGDGYLRGRVPIGWEVTRLGEVAHAITKGATPTTYGFAYQSEGIRFVKVENVKNGAIHHETIKQFISDEADATQSRSRLMSGDVLFSIAGTIGETCVVRSVDLPANTNQALAIIRGTETVFTADFLKLLLDSFVADAVRARARGGAMNNVSLGDLRELPVLIPPFAEQNRIVAKVDQLMALCDELEKGLDRSFGFSQGVLSAIVSAV